MKNIIPLVFILIFGCAKTPDKPDPVDPRVEIEARYEEAYTRLNSRFLENGWVVSRKPDGSPQHVGDSLIWSGTYLSIAKCEDAVVEDNLIAMVEENDGALIRYSPLGEYENGREVTLDGALGLYRGILSRMVRCPDAAAKWDFALTLHRQYLAANGQSLNVRADSRLQAGFEKLPDVVAGFKDESVAGLLTSIVGWSLAVKATHSAAFRVNLSFLAIQILEDGGYKIPQLYRDGFCAATNGVNIYTVDHWCGREGLQNWIENFQYNEYEYRHQRGAWETPDGDGDETPALDFLVAVRQFYK